VVQGGHPDDVEAELLPDVHHCVPPQHIPRDGLIDAAIEVSPLSCCRLVGGAELIPRVEGRLEI
jgi:hypothetical protein